MDDIRDEPPKPRKKIQAPPESKTQPYNLVRVAACHPKSGLSRSVRQKTTRAYLDRQKEQEREGNQ